MSDVQPPARKSLYKYVDIAGAKRIAQGSIRFTQPSAFNDPFELLPAVVIPPKYLGQQLNLSFDLMGVRRDKRNNPINVDGADLIPSDDLSRGIVCDLNKKIGMLCLCKVADSLLMWSHYADQYAGAVIEFDGEHDFFASKFDMEYSVERPIRNIEDYLLADAHIPLADLCVKSEQWSYEQEVRVVRNLIDCRKLGNDARGFPVYVQDVPVDAIRSVTLGERTGVESSREIVDVIAETTIALDLAAVDQSGYQFRKERIKFNVPLSKMSPMVSPRTAHLWAHQNNDFGELCRWMIANHPMSAIVNKRV